jgi:hypothetical protein
VGESSSTIRLFNEFSKAIEPEKSPSFGAGWMGVDWAYQSPVKTITKVEDRATGATWTKETGWQKPLFKPREPSTTTTVGPRFNDWIKYLDPNDKLISYFPRRDELEEELRKSKRQLEQDIMKGDIPVAAPNGITRGMDYSLYGDDYQTLSGTYVQSGSTVGGKPMIANKDEAFVKSENAALLGQVALYLDQIGKNYDQLLERNERSLDEVEPCSCGNPYSQPPTPLQKVRTLNSEITSVLEILKRIVG